MRSKKTDCFLILIHIVKGETMTDTTLSSDNEILNDFICKQERDIEKLIDCSLPEEIEESIDICVTDVFKIILDDHSNLKQYPGLHAAYCRRIEQRLLYQAEEIYDLCRKFGYTEMKFPRYDEPSEDYTIAGLRVLSKILADLPYDVIDLVCSHLHSYENRRAIYRAESKCSFDAVIEALKQYAARHKLNRIP